MYKLFIFDLDGTLIDSDFMLEVTFLNLYEKYRKGYKPDQTKFATFSGPPILETVSKEFPDQDPSFMAKEYERYSKMNYSKYVKLYPYVKEMLEMFKKKNIFFGIVTNKEKEATINAYKILGIDDLLKLTICGDDVENYKPAPDGIYKIMDLYNIKNKKEVIYIGDSKYDYLTAINSGVDFGYVKWSPRKLPSDSKVDLFIDSFKTFAEKI